LRLFGFQNCFKSVRRNADNFKAAILPEFLEDVAPPLGEIVYHENAHRCLIADSLLLLRVRPNCAELTAAGRGSQARLIPSLPLSNFEFVEAQSGMGR
jgi:hypothetical protein